MSVWFDFKKDIKDKHCFESEGYSREFWSYIKEFVFAETYINEDDEYPWYKLDISCLAKINKDNDLYDILEDLFKKAQQDIIFIKYQW